MFHDASTIESMRVVTVSAEGSSEDPEIVEAFGFFRVPVMKVSDVIAQHLLHVESELVLQKLSQTQGTAHTWFDMWLTHDSRDDEPSWQVRLYRDGVENPFRVLKASAYSNTKALVDVAIDSSAVSSAPVAVEENDEEEEEEVA